MLRHTLFSGVITALCLCFKATLKYFHVKSYVWSLFQNNAGERESSISRKSIMVNSIEAGVGVFISLFFLLCMLEIFILQAPRNYILGRSLPRLCRNTDLFTLRCRAQNVRHNAAHTMIPARGRLHTKHKAGKP